MKKRIELSIVLDEKEVSNDDCGCSQASDNACRAN
jgi:hypothetical protein